MKHCVNPLINTKTLVNVVFVGDSPSSKNVDHDIPFVGANCFKRLTEWIKIIEPDYYVVLNSQMHYDIDKIKKLHASGFSIIALGEKAYRRMQKADIPSFAIPHPSGLNRKTNNKEEVACLLQAAKDYVRSNLPVSS